jgi:hypothetical protein
MRTSTKRKNNPLSADCERCSSETADEIKAVLDELLKLLKEKGYSIAIDGRKL